MPDSEVIYCARRKKSFRDEETGGMTPDAFVLRESDGQVENGISVSLGSMCKPEDCGRNLRKRHGVVRMTVGEIRALGLDVVRDSLDDIPEHALIVGMPAKSKDPFRAEFLAGELAKLTKPEIED